MTILDKIIDTKKGEVADRKKQVSEFKLEEEPGFRRTCISMKSILEKEGSSGIIAEFKQKSPSKGIINPSVNVEEVTRNYVLAGASALSVLTDTKYFGGSSENLIRARRINPDTPILRKDFMIDEYQITEAKALGADVILLIAACLDRSQAEILARKAKSLGMEVLMEVHSVEELELLNGFVDMVGVNNRNLNTFEVDVETSVRLAEHIPAGMVKISESGLSSPETIRYLRSRGFKGFLIGETFMKTKDPGKACKELISLR